MTLLTQATLYAIRAKWVDEIPRTHFDGCFLTRGHPGCAIARLLGHIDALEDRAKEQRAENDTLKGILAKSNLPCIYCQLPADRMAECKSGFPGCARADDIMTVEIPTAETPNGD